MVIMKFISDSMLGKLARWLRLMGHDVVYKRDFDDDEVISSAEGRVILTRDRELFERAKKEGRSALLLRSTDVKGQLMQLKEEVNLRLQDTPRLSRCPLCNKELEKIEKEKVRGKVPPKVFQNSEFWFCSDCQKIYWEGGHWKDIREMVRYVQNTKR